MLSRSGVRPLAAGSRSPAPAHDGTGRAPLPVATGDRGREPAHRWVTEARDWAHAQHSAVVARRAELVAQIGNLTGADRIIANLRAAPLLKELDAKLAAADEMLATVDSMIAESAEQARKD